MNQRHENSLLFSLAELRAIEDARIAEEIEAERSAQEAAEAQRAAKLAREEEEAAKREQQRRAAHERALAEERAAERRERRALEEAERLAKVAAEERLAQQRLALEATTSEATRSPRWPIPTLAGLALACGALAFAYFGATDEREQSRSALTSLENRFDRLEEANVSLSEKTQSDAVVIARLEVELREAKRAASAPAAETPTAKRPRPRPRPRPASGSEPSTVRPSGEINIDTSKTGDPLAGMPTKKKKKRRR